MQDIYKLVFRLFIFARSKKIVFQKHLYFQIRQNYLFRAHKFSPIKQKKLSSVHIVSLKCQKFVKLAMISAILKDNLQ